MILSSLGRRTNREPASLSEVIADVGEAQSAASAMAAEISLVRLNPPSIVQVHFGQYYAFYDSCRRHGLHLPISPLALGDGGFSFLFSHMGTKPNCANASEAIYSRSTLKYRLGRSGKKHPLFVHQQLFRVKKHRIEWKISTCQTIISHLSLVIVTGPTCRCWLGGMSLNQALFRFRPHSPSILPWRHLPSSHSTHHLSHYLRILRRRTSPTTRIRAFPASGCTMTKSTNQSPASTLEIRALQTPMIKPFNRNRLTSRSIHLQFLSHSRCIRPSGPRSS